MNNNKKAIKSGFWYTFCSFLTRGIAFLTTPIFTRILSHAEFGYFQNFTSWVSILGVIASLKIGASLISARYDYEKEFDKYIFSVLTFSLSSVFLWTIALNVFYQQIADILGLSQYYMNCMLIYIMFQPVVDMYQTREQFYFRYKKSVLVSLILSISTAVLSVLLVSVSADKLNGRVLGYIIPTTVIGICLFIYFAIRGKGLNLKCLPYALKICIPYVPHLLSLSVLNSMDKIMITRYCGTEDTAVYSVAYTCGSVVTVILNAMNTAFAPWLGEKLHLKKYEEIRAFSKKYIILFNLFTIGIMLLTPELMLIMGGHSYLDSKYVMPPVAAGCVFQFFYTIFALVEQFEKKTVGMAIASVSAALLNYILNLIFIPKYGYIAAAYTTLASYIWLMLMHMYFVKRIGKAGLYSYKFVAVISGIIVGFSILMNALYQVDTLRWILVLLYLCMLTFVCIKYKRSILLLMKKEDK